MELCSRIASICLRILQSVGCGVGSGWVLDSVGGVESVGGVGVVLKGVDSGLDVVGGEESTGLVDCGMGFD